jgi:translation initiation factor eIF-2B subunit beta
VSSLLVTIPYGIFFLELAVGNMVRRVLRLIRDEYRSIPDDGVANTGSGGSHEEKHTSVDVAYGSHLGVSDELSDKKMSRRAYHGRRRESEDNSSAILDNVIHSYIIDEEGKATSPVDSSMYNLLAYSPSFRDTMNYTVSKYSLKPHIIQGINELIDELTNSRSLISSQSLDHIQNGDTIVTIGKSKTVEEFLLFAARKRTFSVYIAETAPLYVLNQKLTFFL